MILQDLNIYLINKRYLNNIVYILIVYILWHSFFWGGGKRILTAEEIKAKPSPFHHRESNANGISKLKYIYWT